MSPSRSSLVDEVNYAPLFKTLGYDEQLVSDSDNIHVGSFEKLRKLGEGGIAKVYLVKGKSSSGIMKDRLFAMKVMSKEKLLSMTRGFKRAMVELEILSTCQHPFIPKLYHAFQDEESLYFIMQYCHGGSLSTVAKSKPDSRLSEDEVRFYISEVITSLEYLHAHGFIHRDLKPCNVLLHESGHCLLVDFDLSMRQTFASPNLVRRRRSSISERFGCQPPPSGSEESIGKLSKKTAILDTEARLMDNARTALCGTLEYMAPELVDGRAYGGSVDWWMVGVFMYELLHGYCPFKGEDDIGVMVAISDDTKPTFGKWLSGTCRSLLKGLLAKDMSRRLRSPADIKRHPFFRGVNWALVRSQVPPIIPPLLELSQTCKGAEGGQEGQEGQVPAPKSVGTDDPTSTATAPSPKGGAGGNVVEDAPAPTPEVAAAGKEGDGSDQPEMVRVEDFDFSAFRFDPAYSQLSLPAPYWADMSSGSRQRISGWRGEEDDTTTSPSSE